MNNPAYRKLMAGNVLDILFDSLYEMHNLTADPFISRTVEELSEEHKEVLCFLSLRLCRATRLAAVRGQSDRNICKLRKTIRKKLQHQMHDHLCGKQVYGGGLTLRNRQLKEVPNIVLDALKVGMLMMGSKPEAEVEKAVMEFITRYGLLGLMTALPTTPYIDRCTCRKTISSRKNPWRRTNICLCDQPDLVKKGIESTWNVSSDWTMVALSMTFMDESMAKNMSFQREYAEPYDWAAQQFKDWALSFSNFA